MKVLMNCIRTLKFDLQKAVSLFGSLSLLKEEIKNHLTDMNPVADQLKKIIPEDNSYAKSTLGDRLEVSSKDQKLLGVFWNFAYDDLVFAIKTQLNLPTGQNQLKGMQ